MEDVVNYERILKVRTFTDVKTSWDTEVSRRQSRNYQFNITCKGEGRITWPLNLT